MDARKCTFRPKNWIEAEYGCPLDHCPCGTHDVDNLYHECEMRSELDAEIAAAEAAAGWDPNP